MSHKFSRFDFTPDNKNIVIYVIGKALRMKTDRGEETVCLANLRNREGFHSVCSYDDS